MVIARFGVVALLLLTPVVSRAVDLYLSADTSVEYDNNVFRTDSREKNDVSFRMGPIIQLADEERKFSYSLRYNPVYEKFVEYDDLDHLNHFASGGLTYQFSDRTSLTIDDRFSFTQSVNSGAFNDDPESGQDPDTETGRDDVYRNYGSIELRHNFSPRTVGQLVFSTGYFDADRANTSQALSFEGLTSLTYALNAKNRIGGGGGVTYQEYDGTRRNPGSDTLTYRIFGSWVRTFGESTELSVRLGPALIDSHQDLDDTQITTNTSPFARTTQTGTVGVAYGSVADANGVQVAGLDLPAGTFTMTAPGVFVPTPAGTIVQANSFLVPASNLIPGASPCGGAVDGQLVFSESACPFSVIVDPVTNPAVAPVAATILAGQNMTSTQLQANADDDDLRFAIFGEVALTHRWSPTLNSALSYVRSDSALSSLGSTTISDRVTFQTNWNPGERWNVNLRADWLKRESSNDSELTFTGISYNPNGLVQLNGNIVTDEQNQAVDTTYWAVSGLTSYRVTKRGRITFRLTYQNQDTKHGGTIGNSTFENVLGFVGFRYDLDPFHF